MGPNYRSRVFLKFPRLALNPQVYAKKSASISISPSYPLSRPHLKPANDRLLSPSFFVRVNKCTPLSFRRFALPHHPFHQASYHRLPRYQQAHYVNELLELAPEYFLFSLYVGTITRFFITSPLFKFAPMY